MKKFLILALCFCLFGSTLVVHAADNGSSVVNGMYLFNDTILLPSPYEDGSAYFEVEFTERRIDSEGNERFGETYECLEIYGDSDYFIMGWYEAYAADITEVYDSDYGWYELYENRRTVFFDNVSVDPAFSVWLHANATELLCDGSTCPVGDTDNDGICEDCYRSIRSVESPSTPSEPAPYPDYLPSHSTLDQYRVVIYNSDGEIYLSAFTEPTVLYGNHLNQLTAEPFLGFEYKYILNGDYWSNVTGSKPVMGEYFCNQSDIIWANFDIYYETGELFFPLPLWAMVEKVTQGGIMKEIPTVHSSMVLLAVCGIGFLALLILLPLLKKVLYKFL